MRQGFLSLKICCVVFVVVCVGLGEIIYKKMVLCTKHDVHVVLHAHVITGD